jgi:hypothetical protein
MQSGLPVGLRLASAAVPFYALAALVVLRCAGVPIRWMPVAFARNGTRVLIGLLALSALANAVPLSPWERYVLGPIAVSLAALSLVVLRGGARVPSEGAEPSRQAAQLRPPDGSLRGHSRTWRPIG